MLQRAAANMYGKFIDFEVAMNGRLTSTAGRAFLKSGKLEFSTSLYVANREAFLNDTVPHEFAHLVAYQVYGDEGHGAGWKSVMVALGYEPTRCHSYETAARKSTKTYKFECACMVHEFTPQRMAWVRKGKVYRCNHCNNILKEVK